MSFVLGIGLYGSVYLLPLFLAQVRGYNSLQIGLVMMVTGTCQFISAPIVGILSKKLDLRIMLAIGLTLFGSSVWLNHYVTSDWGFWELATPQAIRGFSLMLCFVPINSLALGTLPVDRLKNASGLYNLMRNLGGDATLPATKILWRMMEQQAHVLTFSDCLLLMSLVFFGAVFLMPLIHKPRASTQRGH